MSLSNDDENVNFGAKDLLMSGGVSRSGRVRKKSSKLVDFQSPDELEKKTKPRAIKTVGRRGRGRPPIGLDFDIGNDVDIDVLPDLSDMENLNASPVDLALDVKLLDESTETVGNNTHALVSNQTLLDNLLVGAPDSEDELDNLVADLVESVEAESLEHNKSSIDQTVRQSLYMTEKANKRKLQRNINVITGRSERKDKGKSRHTAYSLWAREFRKSSKFTGYQELDFCSVARRLGELWANVSNKEKSVWRRKAKQHALRAKDMENQPVEQTLTTSPSTYALTKKSPATPSTSTYATSFLNRATTSRTKKLAEAAAAAAIKALNSETAETSVKKPRRRGPMKRNIFTSPQDQEQQIDVMEEKTLVVASEEATADVLMSLQPTTHDIKAKDAAAHLKLLGESLSIIGKRLKEHDGQIAVSGSLSVLLDSVLCSMGPLLCLTTQIPGLEHKPELHENLNAILDNIAYIMPGL